MKKAPEALRTIGEVADAIDVPQHVLRFWESKFSPLRPRKRGGGRRYYRPDDVILVRGIRHLLYGEGFTIRGVQKILREKGPGFVMKCGEHGGVSEGPVLDMDKPARENAGSFSKSAQTDDKTELPAAAECKLRKILDELSSIRTLLMKGKKD